MKRRRLAALALLGTLAAGGAAAEPAATVLSVLTYNIRGLPAWIAGDDPRARIPQILARTQPYDVVLIQEDFAHHDVVLAHNPFRVLLRGNDAWWRWFQGAGLTILSNLESVASHREPYGICSGWLWSAGDCFGHKGFLQARLVLPHGGELDVWNTHLDAGGAEPDRATRRTQLDRLAAAIESRSAGRALLVGGDFNLEWDEPRDRALFDAFAARLGLAIAAQTPPDGWDSHLDYVLARSGAATTLERVEGGKAPEFVDAAGMPLSDHPAIAARLRAR